MIDIVIIFVVSVFVLLAFFYLANKQRKKSIRIVIKTIGIGLFMVFTAMNCIIRNEKSLKENNKLQMATL